MQSATTLRLVVRCPCTSVRRVAFFAQPCNSPGPALDIGDWGSRREADWRLAREDWRLESGRQEVFRFEARSRGPPARIPQGTPRRDMQLFEYRSVRYWSKEINGALTGGRKKYFF